MAKEKNTTQENNAKVIKNIEKAISELEKKESTLYFFVVDSKNVPNGSNAYIYNMALTLSKLGYNVKMLYQLENEYTPNELSDVESGKVALDESRIFRGVGEWMGSEYESLPHMNIAREEWRVSPSDFLFIPEALSTLMFETFKHHISCKRYVILQNFDYVTEFIPMGVEWANYGITDAIANTEQAKKDIQNVFPYVNTKVLNPGIPEYFRKPLEPKKLIVSIIAKKQSDVNKIIKTFYWKYPIYKYVSFRDLRGFPREEYAKLLKESAITVWVDEGTKFGYSGVEAIRCGNILIGKIPQDVPEWMGDGETLYDNGIWFDNLKNVPEILASVIGAWMNDEVPAEINEAMAKTDEMYKMSDWEKNVKSTFDTIYTERIEELNQYKNIINDNKNNKATTE